MVKVGALPGSAGRRLCSHCQPNESDTRSMLLGIREGWVPGVVTSSIQVAGLMPVLMGGTFAMPEK